MRNDAITRAVGDIVLHVPQARERVANDPASRAREISRLAARKACMTASTMALPPGVLGWLTVLPEMLAVWKIQAQLVADIAGIYGQTHILGPEQMLQCLFKQVAAQLMRDLSVRFGERVLLQMLGAGIGNVLLKKGVTRFVPLLGAIGVGAYAYADTMQVAQNAVSLFRSPSAAPTDV